MSGLRIIYHPTIPMNRLSALRLVACGVASLLLSSCATTAPKPLSPTQARITGHDDFFGGRWVVVAPAGTFAADDFKHELIVPAGRQRVALRCKLAESNGALFAALARSQSDKTVTEVEFEARAGHEYRAELTTPDLRKLGYRLTDTTTGTVVAEVKP